MTSRSALPVAILSILIVGFIAEPSAAQTEAGVKAGLNIARIHLSPEEASTVFSNLTGLVAGGFVVFDARRPVGVQIEGLYSVKGTTATYLGITGTTTLTYLEVPILARLNVVRAGPTDVHLLVGGLIGLRVRAKGETAGIEIDASDEFKTFDSGLVVGGGVQLGRLVLDGRYNFGLSNISKVSGPTTKVTNRGLSLTAGISF